MTVQADILKAIEGIEHGFQQAGQALSERIFHCRQVHGAEIVDARSLSESGRHAADGVFSEGPLAVAVVTADCLPSHRRRQRLGEEKRQQYAWIARKP